MHGKIAVVALAVLTFGPAKSETVVRGVGSRSCAEFGADYKRDPRAAEILYMSWALGFLSSQNITNVLEHRPMRGLPEAAAISRGIRQECDYHPLAPFFETVLNFYKSQPEVKSKNSN